MNKNIIIGLLAVVVIFETGYIYKKKMVIPRTSLSNVNIQAEKSPETGGKPSPRPQLLTKGMKLFGSQIEKFAYKVMPGDLSEDAKKALIGFNMKTDKLSNGSIRVDLVPKDTDDEFQTYVVKPGNSLFFVEMTPLDDKAAEDKDINYRDDYGIIVDKDGIVQ